MDDKDCRRELTVILGDDVESCSRSNATYGLTII